MVPYRHLSVVFMKQHFIPQQENLHLYSELENVLVTSLTKVNKKEGHVKDPSQVNQILLWQGQ